MKKILIASFSKDIFYPPKPPENVLQITLEEFLFNSSGLTEVEYELTERLSCHYNSFLHPKIAKFLTSNFYNELRIFIGYSAKNDQESQYIKPQKMAEIIAKHIKKYMEISVGNKVKLVEKEIHTVDDVKNIYPLMILNIEEIRINV